MEWRFIARSVNVLAAMNRCHRKAPINRRTPNVGFVANPSGRVGIVFSLFRVRRLTDSRANLFARPLKLGVFLEFGFWLLEFPDARNIQ